MKASSLLAPLTLTITLASCTFALAAEHAVPCSSLPAAVQQKAKAVVGDAAVHGCVRDVSKGKTTYEMETMKDGRSKDITFAADGTVLEVEEQVDMGSLPAPVAAAIQKRGSGGKVGKVESLSRNGTVVSYETVITQGGKRGEVAFRPDGSPMKAD